MDIFTDFTMTIDGRAEHSADAIAVQNPATGAVVGHGPDCSRAQLDQAVAAARRAFPAWAARSMGDRRAALLAMADAIDACAADLKQLLTSEHGKPLGDAERELGIAAVYLRGTTKLDLPVTINEDSATRLSETRHVPLGVVGAITPWNAPVALVMIKIAPALLAGNTVVLKPSRWVPLTILKIGELMRTVLPPGVLNVVSGADIIGPWLTEHPDVDKISYTGSTPTGRKVMAGAAARLKRITLELGGNDPAIVLPDVNVATTAEKLFWSAFRNAGQVCMATKRLYVHDDIYDRFLSALVEYARKVKLGNGAEAGTQIGPLQNRQQFDQVVSIIEDAHARGCKFALGGEIPQGPGYFLPISIIDNPPDDARVVTQEQFGPVLPVLRFSDVDEVIARANAGDYGLAASVWSADLERARAIADRLTAGTVWINESQILSPLVPFGGHKQSGFGTELGIEGLLECTQPKVVSLRRDVH